MFPINKKNKIVLIVLALVLVAFSVAISLLLPMLDSLPNENGSNTSSNSSGTQKHNFFSFSNGDVLNVEITNSHGKITILRITEDKKTSFKFEDNPNVELSATVAAPSVNFISTLSSNVPVSTDETRLSVYGLDNPTVTVKVRLKDNSEKILYIGSEAPAGGFYVNTSDSKDVYLISVNLAYNFMRKRLDYYPLDIFPYVELKDFNGLNLKRPDFHDVDIIKLSDADYEAAVKEAEAGIKSQYELTTPIKYDANELYIEKIVTAFSGATAIQTVSDDVSLNNLKKYGLNNPKTLTLKNKDNEVYYIGNKDAAKNVYYVMKKDVPLIYAVSVENLSFIEDGADKYAYTMLMLPALGKLNKLTLETKTDSYVFDLVTNDNATELEVKYGMKPISPDEFRKLYVQIFMATQNGLATKPASERAFRITYHKKDGTAVKVDYYKIDLQHYYVEVNGEGFFSVKGQMVEKILSDCKRLINGDIIS